MMLMVMQGLPMSGIPRMPMIKGTPAEDALKDLVAYSRKKEHWFQNPNESAEAARKKTDPRPEGGHHAPHTRHITLETSTGQETYHVSFTITVAKAYAEGHEEEAQDVLVKHATIGVGAMERLPDPTEAFTILNFLGFDSQGAVQSTTHPDFPAAVFLQALTEAEEAALRAV